MTSSRTECYPDPTQNLDQSPRLSSLACRGVNVCVTFSVLATDGPPPSSCVSCLFFAFLWGVRDSRCPAWAVSRSRQRSELGLLVGRVTGFAGITRLVHEVRVVCHLHLLMRHNTRENACTRARTQAFVTFFCPPQ